jgi:hypothetical protein
MFEAERIAGTNFEPNRLIEFLRPPFRKFEIGTPMSPAQAESLLQEIVEPRKIFRSPFSRDHRYFEGRVAAGRFKIRRIIHYGNGFLPMIEGRLRRDDSETIVTVNMRLAWPLVIYLSGVMLFVFWVGLSIDSHFLGSFAARMVIWGMLLIYLVAAASFATKVRIAMKRLLRLPWRGEVGSGT